MPPPGSAETSATRVSEMSQGSTLPGDSSSPVVGIVMGSDSDWPVMKAAATALG